MRFELYSKKNIRQLKAIKLKFLRNWRGFLARYWMLLLLLFIAAFLDGLSTWFFMTRAGIHREAHPHILWASVYLGPVWGPAVGKSAQLLLGLPVVIFLRKYALFLLSATTIFYFIASMGNFLAFGFFDYLFLAQ